MNPAAKYVFIRPRVGCGSDKLARRAYIHIHAREFDLITA